MDYINSIPLNGTITSYTPSGSVDKYNVPASYTKAEHDAAIFERTSEKRDDDKIDTDYDTVIYVQDTITKDALIYEGSTSETDPNELLTREIQRFRKMKTVDQIVVGYKLWL